MRYFFYPIFPHAQVVICCLKDWYIMAWENSRHFVAPSDWFPGEMTITSAETPYCWNVTIKIWVVLLIGWKSLYPIRRTTQLLVVTCHRYEISALFAQKSFRVETSGDVAKCRLFSEAYYLIVTKRKGNFVKFHAQKQFGIRVGVELENCEYLWKFSKYTFCFCYYIEIVTTLKPFFKRNWKQFFSRS